MKITAQFMTFDVKDADRLYCVKAVRRPVPFGLNDSLLHENITLHGPFISDGAALRFGEDLVKEEEPGEIVEWDVCKLNLERVTKYKIRGPK